MRPITALVLAGGRSSRMDGLDKGLQPFRGSPLVAHALQRLTQQQGSLIAGCMVSANRHLADYAALGVAVWPDADPDGCAGPLAGFVAGLKHCPTPYLLTVPCDTPMFPLDLAERLYTQLAATGASLALACALDAHINADMHRDESPVLRRQAVFCLMRRELLASAERFLASGGRKVGQWAAENGAVEVAFNDSGDHPMAFANINTASQLQALAETATWF